MAVRSGGDRLRQTRLIPRSPDGDKNWKGRQGRGIFWWPPRSVRESGVGVIGLGAVREMEIVVWMLGST